MDRDYGHRGHWDRYHPDVVIPSARYEGTFSNDGLARYNVLVAAALEVERLGFDEPTDEAFLAGAMRVVALCDKLLAVWDGKPSRGLGGTADVVQYAQSLRRSVAIVWPAGVTR